MTDQEKVDEAVFHKAYIPRTMDEIADFESDLKKMQKATGSANATQSDKSDAARKVDGIYYQTILGMKADLSGPRTAANARGEGQVDSDSEDLNSESGSGDEGGSGDSDGSGEGEWEERKKLSKEEVKALRKENKAKVKAENKEKRKTKIPKHIKKKKTESKGRKK
jgi:RIO kinase 1